MCFTSFVKYLDENGYAMKCGDRLFVPWNWAHGDYKKEWIGKYATSFQNGIFTYGVCYNARHGADECWDNFREVLEEIGEELERHYWDEA